MNQNLAATLIFVSALYIWGALTLLKALRERKRPGVRLTKAFRLRRR